MTYGCLLCNTLAEEKMQKGPQYEKDQVHACRQCHNIYCSDHWEAHVHYYGHKEAEIQV